jgi:hypothetical protein
VDDGFRSLLQEKGAGIQSATIIGLFSYYTRAINATGSALLGIEEPELYLHPHARRVMSDRLDSFLDGNRNQVVLTTHSIEFLRTIESDVNVTLVKKECGRTTATNVSLRSFQKLLRDKNQNELFFADKVIACEGYDDYLIKVVAKRGFGSSLDESNASVIAVGGKDGIAALVSQVLELGLEISLIADFDFLLRDQSAEGKKYGGKAHKSLCDLPVRFFEQPFIFGKYGGPALKVLESLRKSIREANTAGFYSAKTTAELGLNGLAGVLKVLRKAGIGILDGEIENLNKDGTFMSASNKLNLDKVYDLRKRLMGGDEIEAIIDVVPLIDALEVTLRGQAADEVRFKQLEEAVALVRT